MCKLWKNWTRFFNLCHRMLDVYWKSLLSIPPWMRCHGRVNPPAFLLGFPNSQPVPTYTSGWRETMWSEVSCLRKQHDAIQRPSLRRPFDLANHPIGSPRRWPLHYHASTNRVPSINHSPSFFWLSQAGSPGQNAASKSWTILKYMLIVDFITEYHACTKQERGSLQDLVHLPIYRSLEA